MKQINEYLEYANIEKPLRSFRIKDSLNPLVWDGEKLKSNVRKKLIQIANDVWENFKFNFEYDELHFTGSMCSYNWGKYSDFDLHIIVDYKKISDNEDFVDDFFYYFKKNWNDDNEVKIYGYDVEISIIKKDEPLTYKAVYDLLNDIWITEPKKYEKDIPTDDIKEKVKEYLIEIDEIEHNFDDMTYDEFKKRIKVIWDSIKKGRKEGLDSKEGEMSVDNLVFKMMRRNGYIQKIIDLKQKAYNKEFSL
jgi:hypothetical protein